MTWTKTGYTLELELGMAGRTSDFMPLAAILVGAGAAFGLTSSMRTQDPRRRWTVELSEWTMRSSSIETSCNMRSSWTASSALDA